MACEDRRFLTDQPPASAADAGTAVLKDAYASRASQAMYHTACPQPQLTNIATAKRFTVLYLVLDGRDRPFLHPVHLSGEVVLLDLDQPAAAPSDLLDAGGLLHGRRRRGGVLGGRGLAVRALVAQVLFVRWSFVAMRPT